MNIHPNISRRCLECGKEMSMKSLNGPICSSCKEVIYNKKNEELETEVERAIISIKCNECNQFYELISEFEDKYNSDFFISIYRCKFCGFVITITTHEWRD